MSVSRTMKMLFGGLSWLVGVCTLGQAATLGSHYNYGVEGVLGASAPPPGFHYKMYNFWYSAGSLRDNSGKEAPGRFDLDAFASVQRLVHVTGVKILGADYLYDILVPLVDQDMSVGGGSYSQSLTVGDVTVEPFALAWHQARWDATFALAVVLPTGKYSATDPASAGLGYWSGMMTVGGTYYLDEKKTWSVSALTRTLVNSRQEETHVTPGSEFVLEYGVGKEIQVANNFMVRPGLVGASYWQFQDDSKNAPGVVADQHKQAHALGAEVNLFYLPYLLQVNGRFLREFSVENAPEGSRFILTLTKSW